MAISEKQLKANRENAKRSTGPQTQAGKQVVALNSVTHGATSQALILPGENSDDYRELVDRFKSDFNVSTLIEETLILRMAEAMWKKQRLAKYEQAVIQANADVLNASHGNDETLQSEVIDLENGISKLKRWLKSPQRDGTVTEACEMLETFPEEISEKIYRNTNELTFVKQVVKLMQDRLKNKQAITREKIAQHRLDILQARSPMANESLRRYEVMLDRQFYKALEELQKLQVFMSLKKK